MLLLACGLVVWGIPTLDFFEGMRKSSKIIPPAEDGAEESVKSLGPYHMVSYPLFAVRNPVRAVAGDRPLKLETRFR